MHSIGQTKKYEANHFLTTAL